ncbi:CAMK family protein kinase [Tritrichomonas foetus]|uniref:CAMK family protein kinase n=1 Tax=Tritrichomonas foetus TaxID=1144522 RepID=A0A1J4JCK0_9EUKA|nr:CAMK family protein kinase [Tritrichomonas foetus]|eukprot:OHS95141.1 CAMK family protein kinase [Tritrichomonas foetus]
MQAQGPQEIPRLGPYVLTKHLGQGTTGKVKLAINTETQQLVAIKIICKESFAQRPNLQTKIQREIALMRLVDHPHLLKLVDVLESPRHLYIVLEYAQNGELFDFLVQRNALEPDIAMKFFRQIIYGLEYLHSLGICHRDLKPENILLDSNLNIKIADFGFARFVKSHIAETACGSPHYAAPEVIKGQPYDGRSADIWSCGVILYALLAVCNFFRAIVLFP